ncbi:sugar ABC transporter substrate-binding protein [bacterium]|nr:sugar ABC transporter substrate-binding protein [bacterium]
MKIVYYVPDAENPFWKEVVSGVEKRALRAGIALDIVNAGRNVKSQAAQLESCADRKPAAVLVSPVDPSGIASVCRSVIKAGIPIVAVDDNMSTDVTASVVCGNLKGGTAAAMRLADRLGVGGRVVHIESQDIQNILLRRRSFLSEIERRQLFVVKTLKAESDRKQAYETLKAFLNEEVSFGGIFAENDAMALGAMQAVQHRRPEPWPVIVGYDGVLEALHAIRDGRMDATVSQNPELLGQKAAEIVVQVLGKKPYETLTSVLPKLVTKENLNE